MTPDEAVELVGGLADEEDTLMDQERQAIGVLLAERQRLRAALDKAVAAAEYVVNLCEANNRSGESPNPYEKADWVATVAHCYAAMAFVGEARAALASKPQQSEANGVHAAAVLLGRRAASYRWSRRRPASKAQP